MEMYYEIKIELTAAEIVKILQKAGYVPLEPYIHNQTIISGFKDIGLNGWVVFVLRRREVKNETDEKIK